MKTLVFLKDVNGNVYCEEPSLRIGQRLDVEAYIKKLNRNMKEQYKYTECVLVDQTDNFHDSRSKARYIDRVMQAHGWKH